MIPLFKVAMSEDAAKNVQEVLTCGYISQGPKVDEFEYALQKELQTSNLPVTVNSCTSAIDLSLQLCNINPGDEVISTPQTCFASQIGILHRKATIRWADIDPVSGLIDPDYVKSLITEKTKAIVAVNWAGKICDFKSLKSHGIPVIEDAAHTWDSFLTDRTIDRGDLICYSFQAIKFLTSGDGGAIVCNEDLAQRARILRWFGLDRTKNESFRCTQNIKEAGFKYHMNDINATIGLSNIHLARQSVLKHRENTKYMIDNIKNDLIVLPEYDDTTSYWLFSMHVLEGKKEDFTSYMERKGITCSPVHFRNDLYDCTIEFKEKELEGVKRFTDTQVCIPNGWWLSSNELDYIIETVNAYA
jgi:perosamine synthetase